MTHLLSVLALAYVFAFVCWVLYLAVMNLAGHRDEMGPVAKAHAYCLLAFGYTFDILLNVVLGTIIFADLPREWVLTSRLKRYHRTQSGTWRDRVATWICMNLLNPFAPGGKHC